MKPLEFSSQSPSDLKELCAHLKSILTARHVLLLYGPMGSGKTTLISELVRFLGGREVSSPTFALHQSYKIAGGTLEHFDLYRVESVDELETTGFWDMFGGRDQIIAVEWAERLKDIALPRDWAVTRVNIRVEGQGRGERRVLSLS